jgi:DNA gyrase subunit A
VITELPYQVNHDNFITSIAEQVRDGRLAGISNIEDQSSDRVGLRIVVEIKRAVAKLNNLYKHTQLQTSFGANMLSIVDGVPRTLPSTDDPLLRRAPARRHRPADHLPAAQGQRARPHPARLVKALDALDEVIALIRASPTVESPAPA